MSRLALTIDLEEYFQVSNFAEVIDRGSWDGLESRVLAQTERLLTAFEETGNRATFFALGWVAERHPALIREIAEHGHEIACHGYGHELVYEIGAQRFRDDLRKSKALLEAACGAPVVGYRAPSYSVTRDSLWALDILAEEGFRYDSSIFPIHHHRYGIPGFTRRPVELELASGARIREFPLTTLQAGPLTLPLAGGAYLRFLPEPVFSWGWQRLVARDEPAVLYLHPWEIDPGQPRQDVGLRVRVNHYFNLGRTEGRLRRLLERFRFDSMAAVLDALAAEERLPGRPLAALLAPRDAA